MTTFRRLVSSSAICPRLLTKRSGDLLKGRQTRWVSTPKREEKQDLSCRSTPRCSNAADSFRCLVNVDAKALESANVQINDSGFLGTFTTVPVIDGKLIIERPLATIERGILNTVGKYPYSTRSI